jgi:hypothetical protein
VNLSGQFGRKRQFRVPVIAADAPERIHDRPNHDSVDSERRISRRVAENPVVYGKDLRFSRSLIEVACSCVSTLAKHVALSKLFSDGHFVLDC